MSRPSSNSTMVFSRTPPRRSLIVNTSPTASTRCHAATARRNCDRCLATFAPLTRFHSARGETRVPAEDEFRDFVVARSPGLLRFAWMLTYDEGRAEDLLQTSLAKTWLHWGRLHDDGEPLAYVRRVMVNTSSAWWRRRWRAEVPTDAVPDSAGRDAYGASDDRDVLTRALAALPRRQRAVVVLRYYEGLSEAETADALGCSVGTVKSQAARGLARLREVDAVNEPVEESR